MNKWLSEIEISATRRFGDKNARMFTDDTRPIADGMYSRLKRNIRSRYGKIAVILLPQYVIDEYSMPSHHYDDIGGVCMINRGYELYQYHCVNSLAEKEEIVYKILNDAIENSEDQVGLERQLAIELLTDVYQKTKSES